jgi:dinuclear metal center YbgI/SA1388 family protein
VIFRGLKSITLQDPQQATLIRLANANIAVYSPHTAVDAAERGMNDWWADLLESAGEDVQVKVTERVVIKSLANSDDKVGYGRVVRFAKPLSAAAVIEHITGVLNVSPHIMVAAPRVNNPPQAVSSIAVCVGSGWDVLKDCDADMLVTGEMSHHSALNATMRGKWVVTTFHSNSERVFLRSRMNGQLYDTLLSAGVDAKVEVSERDRDPFEIQTPGKRSSEA